MNKECAIYKTSNLIGKKWTILLILELYKGDKIKRYSELKRAMKGITPKILSERLKELEKAKMISKKIDASSFPIKTEYQLTKSGELFIKIIKDMRAWALRWEFKTPPCKESDCKHCEL